MNAFVKAVKNTPVEDRTENGMKAFASTCNHNVDLFSQIGASRGKNVSAEFEKAFQEEKDLALRIALWTRDVRGGAGERQLFRDILLHLEKFHPSVLTSSFLKKVPELGRWDDLLIFTNIKIQNAAFKLILEALREGNGLAAKWLPRKGPIALKLRSYFKMSPKQYRKTLVNLTKVVETAMCAKDWSSINFEHVPSLAMSRYMTAFHKNAGETFVSYKNALVKGTAKINATAVYPYDIIKSLRHGGDETVNDKQWDALPDYMDGSLVLPLVDVSGSMDASISPGAEVNAMDVALSLGLYCAGKNKGPYKDTFLTFSGSPELITLKGTLSQKMIQMNRSHWDMSTNLHKAFERILSVAVKNNVPEKDMPEVLLILSDMQFDQCTKYDDSALEMIQRKYTKAGYKVPMIVFWNLRATKNSPVKFDQKGTALVSGFSPAIMKSVLKSKFENITPEAIMRQTVCVARYDYR